METPLTDHLTSLDFEQIYEPSEDTFLLLDALEADLSHLQKLQPHVCVEIGSGSGVLITALAKNISNCLFLATDVNLKACHATKATAKRNATFVEAINCNLLDALRPHTVDVLLFNPPYVVTTDTELMQLNLTNSAHTKANLVQSWAGGRDGRRVIDELLQRLGAALSAHCVFYLLLLHENKPDEVLQQLREMNFKATKFMERRIPGERLCIIKATRE